MTTTTPEAPALATVTSVDIVAAGTWQLSTGEATFTTEDLANAIDASQCPAVGSPVIKLGHVDPRFDGEPAIGRVANMALSQSGNKITGDLAGMPGWLAAANEDGETVIASAYPNRSIEGCWDFVCQIGHTHPFVITGLALLGVAMPGVGVLSGLEAVEALYGVTAAASPGVKWTLEGQMGKPVMASVTTEDVRRAYYASPNVGYSYWITELQLDPAQLIVADEASAKVYRVPMTIKGSEVTFGDPIEVEVEYVDVPAAKAAAARVTFASAAESRKGIEPPPEAKPGDPATAGAIDRLREIQGKIRAQAADADDDVRSLMAGLDATLDEACELVAGKDISDPDVAQAMALLTAAEAVADELMDLLGIADPDESEPEPAAASRRISAAHGVKGTESEPMTHSHAHAAMGAQGDDVTHSHEHAHAGDAKHDHAHASAGDHKHAPATATGVTPPGKNARAGNNGNGGADVDFTDEQNASLRAALGLGDEDELTAAVIVEGVQKQKVAASRGQLPAGVIAVDQERWDALNARVKSAEDYQARQKVKERDVVIAAAVKDGKFSAARKPYWVRLWDVDPDGTREVLATLQKNVVPMQDIGTPGGSDDELLEDEYKSLFPPGSVKSS